MQLSYHVQQLGQVTFIAEKEGNKWLSIDVGLSMAETLEQSRGAIHLATDLNIHTICPTSIIEAINATPFQKSVWRAIVRIRPGDTASYTDLAVQVGRPRAIRAVANACGANRFAGVIPCHRVIGANRKLGGYRWGPQVKAALLAAEQSLRDDLEKA